MRFILLTFLIALSFAVPAYAETPLEITADTSLEWFRDQQKFVATDNAKAVQGDVSLDAAKLTADYKENAKGDIEVWQIVATDDVIINSRDSNAYGDRAVYTVDKSLAVMTGENLRMVSPDQTLTAKERFEYHVDAGRLIAVGDAMIKRPKLNGEIDTLESERVIATLKDNGEGKRVLHTLEATGGVKITTDAEIITGDYGIYRAGSNIAEVTGEVQIRRGLNVIEGEKAQVDLNTNISRMFGSKQNGGRVRGVFFPGSEKKKGE